jgi:hypothetical protein
MGALSYAQTAGTVLTVAWALKSLIAYHTWSLEEVMDDVASSPLPLNEKVILHHCTSVVSIFDLRISNPLLHL